RHPPETDRRVGTTARRLPPEAQSSPSTTARAAGAGSAVEAAERRADEAAAHDLELAGDLPGELVRLGATGGVPAPGDRDERVLGRGELALGGGAEPPKVARLDAGALQLDERAEDRQRILAVELRRQDERGRD